MLGLNSRRGHSVEGLSVKDSASLGSDVPTWQGEIVPQGHGVVAQAPSRALGIHGTGACQGA